MDESKEAVDHISENEECVSTQIANDHDHVKGLYRQYLQPDLEGGDDARQRVVWELVRCLSVHIYAAQEVLEPAIAEAAGAGECDIGRDTDTALVAALADLDALPATAPVMGGHGGGAAAAAGGGEFGARLERLMDLFFRHARHEEHLMPTLREALGARALLQLGRRFRSAKAHVPTRPHPGGERLLGSALLAHVARAPLDYVRDRWRFGFGGAGASAGGGKAAEVAAAPAAAAQAEAAEEEAVSVAAGAAGAPA